LPTADFKTNGFDMSVGLPVSVPEEWSPTGGGTDSLGATTKGLVGGTVAPGKALTTT